MQDYVIWFILAGVLIAIEMATGTFYFLVFAVAMAGGGVAALLGVDVTGQILTAAVIGILGTVALNRWKSKSNSHLGGSFPNDLDIGERVDIVKRRQDGTARVSYRGSQWDAELQDSAVDANQALYIVGKRGSTLLLANRPAKEAEQAGDNNLQENDPDGNGRV